MAKRTTMLVAGACALMLAGGLLVGCTGNADDEGSSSAYTNLSEEAEADSAWSEVSSSYDELTATGQEAAEDIEADTAREQIENMMMSIGECMELLEPCAEGGGIDDMGESAAQELWQYASAIEALTQEDDEVVSPCLEELCTYAFSMVKYAYDGAGESALVVMEEFDEAYTTFEGLTDEEWEDFLSLLDA